MTQKICLIKNVITLKNIIHKKITNLVFKEIVPKTDD